METSMQRRTTIEAAAVAQGKLYLRETCTSGTRGENGIRACYFWVTGYDNRHTWALRRSEWVGLAM